jgi:hypothetical protein
MQEMLVNIRLLLAHRIHSVPGDVHCILQRLTAANGSRCVRSCSSLIARQKRLGNVRWSCERRVGKIFHTSVRFVGILRSQQNIELRFVVAPWNKLCFILTPIVAKHTNEVIFTTLCYKPPSFITSTTKCCHWTSSSNRWMRFNPLYFQRFCDMRPRFEPLWGLRIVFLFFFVITFQWL